MKPPSAAPSLTLALIAALSVALGSACQYPPRATDDDDGTGGDADADGDGDGDPGPTGAECESHEDCGHFDFAQCLNDVCVSCDESPGYCPTNYTCVSGACVLSCPMNGEDPGHDVAEPNDTPETAYALSDGEDLDLWLCPGDVDYFEFEVASATVAYVSIIVNSNPFDGDVDLQLVGPSMAPMVSESKFYGKHIPRSVEALHAKLTTAGTYTLKAHLPNGKGGLPYRLTVRILVGS